MRFLLILPPLSYTSWAIAYAALPKLTGFLQGRGHDSRQEDASLHLLLRMFSDAGLRRLERSLREEHGKRHHPPTVARFLRDPDRWFETVGPVLRFLQGKDPTLAVRIGSMDYLPEGHRSAYRILRAQQASFGELDFRDRAYFRASAYLDDVFGLYSDAVEPALRMFSLVVPTAPGSFSELLTKLEGKPTLLDSFIEEIACELVEKHAPSAVGFSVPFEGTLYGSFRMAGAIRKRYPHIKLVVGGPFASMRMRRLSEPRVFDYFDNVVLKDGEDALPPLFEFWEGARPATKLVRTFGREDGRVCFWNDEAAHPQPVFADDSFRTVKGLAFDDYFAYNSTLRREAMLLSTGSFVPLQATRGCYWARCAFCDVEAAVTKCFVSDSPGHVVEEMKKTIQESGRSGFALVDEALPPAMALKLSSEILAQRLTVSWYSMIRFERHFTPEIISQMAKAGCISVGGGIEIPNERLLKLMNKGLTLEEIVEVTHRFSTAGIFVSAFLMFGFPGQTERELVDSLEVTRQLFKEGCIHSAALGRFQALPGAPVGRQPEKYGRADDADVLLYERYATGLRHAIAEFSCGRGYAAALSSWFTGLRIPKTSVDRHYVRTVLARCAR